MAASVEQADQIINDESLAEEKLLDELENEEIPAHIREARLSQFKQMSRDFCSMKDQKHGSYTEFLEERTMLEMTTTEDRCVVHFYHPDFRRCSIMDNHMKTLSEKHFETRFGKISVEKAKFLVSRLKIQVLPAVLCFVKAIVVDRIIGFDDLGNTDDFPTEVLEKRLASSGVIFGKQGEKKDASIFGYSKKKDTSEETDSSDDDD